MQIKPLVCLGSTFIVALGATTRDVLNDIITLGFYLNTLDDDLNNFSGGIAGALGIHNDAINVQFAADDITDGVRGIRTPLSEGDTQSILDAINGIAPIIEDSLRIMVAKKSNFESIPLGGIKTIRGDISKLFESTSNLQGVLITSTHPDFRDEANALRNEIDAAFKFAIAAFG